VGDFDFPHPDWQNWQMGGVNVSSSNYVPDGTLYMSGGRVIAAPKTTAFINDLLDTDKAETQAAKLRELMDLKPSVELLERLDSEYVGEPELVQVIDDYVIEFTTRRGKMRVFRRPGETWEECLIRMGLLDA
jgi:hypothetical protein